MFKIFSNTILSYLEDDLNKFTKTHIIKNIYYSTVVSEEGEIVHSLLVEYT
jgi:hypothetical protein